MLEDFVDSETVMKSDLDQRQFRLKLRILVTAIAGISAHGERESIRRPKDSTDEMHGSHSGIHTVNIIILNEFEIDLIENKLSLFQ
jgi:hypothetical protein